MMAASSARIRRPPPSPHMMGKGSHRGKGPYRAPAKTGLVQPDDATETSIQGGGQ